MKKVRGLALRIGSIGLVLLFSLCMFGHADARITVRDDRGVMQRFTAPPQRIVSLLPSLTETVCALGGCDRLVGIDRYSSWPASIRALPRLGGLDDAQIERIVALKPHVVLASKSARVTERLEALGVPVVAVETRTHAEVKRTLELVAQLLDSADAPRVWTTIQQSIDAAAASVPPSLRGKRVYFEVGSAPYAAGAGSFIGETLDRLGLGNIVPPEMGPFPKLNPEFVVRSRPDIVMASKRELETMPARPGWQGLQALDGRSCGFAPGVYDVLVRPGPRMGEAAHVLAQCLAGLKP